MKIIGNAQFAADRAAVCAALNDPAVLVRMHPRLPAARGARRRRLRDDGRRRGRLHQGRVRRRGAAHRPAAARLVPHARAGRRRRGHDRRRRLVTLEESAAGGTSVTYDADATVGGMIGGVGQRMLVGVSKRMAAEFFGNVETAAARAGATPAAARREPSGASRRPAGPHRRRLRPRAPLGRAGSRLHGAAGRRGRPGGAVVRAGRGWWGRRPRWRVPLGAARWISRRVAHG